LRHFDADGAEADDAERAARQLEADEILLALLHRHVDGVVITRLALANDQACVMLRAARNMPASTSSFTALAFAPGALNTGMPFFDRASTGMLLVPAPARPTARRCRAAQFVHVRRAHQDRVGVVDLRGDFEAVARQALEALDEMLLRVWILNRIVYSCAGVIARRVRTAALLPRSVRRRCGRGCPSGVLAWNSFMNLISASMPSGGIAL
jgi:hypothetical protein